MRRVSTVRVSTDPMVGRRRRQRAQQRTLDAEARVRDGHGLAVDPAVDLGTPGHRSGVGVTEVGEGSEPDEQVPLGIAHEVLDDPLRFGVARLAEVDAEAKVGGEG